MDVGLAVIVGLAINGALTLAGLVIAGFLAMKKD